MNVETAKSIVDYELKNFADFEGIEFDLFGGEPFLAFDLVQEITDYICSKKGVEEHRFSNDLKIPRRGRENYKLCQIRLLKIIR